MLLEPGRVCVKKYGRDAGSRAVVTKVLGNGFVNVVTSVRGRERRCNIKHLEFLDENVDPSDKAAVNKVLGISEKEKQKSGEK